MKNTLRNLLITGLIVACVPSITATPKQAATPKYPQIIDVPDYHEPDWWYHSPLMQAARAGDVTKMKDLIKSGEDVSERVGCDFPHGGQCPLGAAINSGSLEAVHILLDAGADVHTFVESSIITGNNESNVRNLSILSHAIHIKAPIAIIKTLIAHGAQADGSPKIMGDWSALMVAAYVGYTEAVQVLLEAGADTCVVNNMDKKTALDYATEQGHTKICKLLKRV